MSARHRLIRLPEVLRLTGRSRSHLYKAISDGTFVRPIKLCRMAYWPVDEVDAINAAVIRSDTDKERREFVRWLEAQRRLAGPRPLALPAHDDS